MNLVRRAAQQIGAGLSLSDLDRMMDLMYGGTPSYTGKAVSQTTSLAVAAVWACIGVLADDIATLPLLTYRRLDNGREPASEHYLWRLLQEEANPEMTAFRFKRLMQSWVSLWGNAYAEIEISGRGQVTALWPWRPDRVKITRAGSATGPLQYTYTTADNKKFTLPHDRIFHLRGLEVDGVTGLSPIDVHKQTVGLSLAMTEHGARYYGQGTRLGGFLQYPGKLGDKAFQNLIESFEARHMGLENAHRVGILEEGLTWKEAGANMVDAQYIQAMGLTNEDIARIFKVAQHRIGLLARSTNNNIEHQGLEHVIYTLMPWGTNWEQEIEYSLLSPRERSSIFTKFNYRNLLKGDHAAMGTFINQMIASHVMNADEVREEFLDMNPQPKGIGKKYYAAVNTQPIGDEPKPEPEPSSLAVMPPVKPNGKPNGVAHQ